MIRDLQMVPKIGGVATKIEENSGKDTNQEQGNFLAVAKESIAVHDVAASGKIGVFVGIEKDFVNDTFDGEFELYLDLGVVKGGGENNLAGYAKIHTGPNDWYMYIGTPTTAHRPPIQYWGTNSCWRLLYDGYKATSAVRPPPYRCKNIG